MVVYSYMIVYYVYCLGGYFLSRHKQTVIIISRYLAPEIIFWTHRNSIRINFISNVQRNMKLSVPITIFFLKKKKRWEKSRKIIHPESKRDFWDPLCMAATEEFILCNKNSAVYLGKWSPVLLDYPAVCSGAWQHPLEEDGSVGKVLMRPGFSPGSCLS